MKGRKPTPTHLKLINGNPGKRRLNANEAKPDLARPMPPPFLNDDAKVEWGRLVDRLYEVGLMTEIDRAALAAYCQAYGRWAVAERALAKMAEADADFGALMTKTKDGNLIQNPIVGVANRAMSDMVKYGAEFGMTPSARSRIDVGFAAVQTAEESKASGGTSYF
jgi:P27 family predicted phage terminase small subunit